MLVRTSFCAAVLLGVTEGFAFLPNNNAAIVSKTKLDMGLFDGVKEAFSAAPLERSEITAERETPIDRWMGWSVVSEKNVEQQPMAQDFVDAMDEANYIAVELTKPMGIVFEENDGDTGGIFVQSIKEGGVADKSGVLEVGDQLVAVNTEKVSGMSFDDALNAIVESKVENTKLVLFRGSSKQLYGPTGASKEWLDEFIAKGGVKSTASASS